MPSPQVAENVRGGTMNIISEKKSDFTHAENFKILSQMKRGNSIN